MKIIKSIFLILITFVIFFLICLFSDKKQEGYILGSKKFVFFFAWYDMWTGLFVDKKKEIIYVCVLPCLVIKIENYNREKIKPLPTKASSDYQNKEKNKNV
jgi:hypothetical protein